MIKTFCDRCNKECKPDEHELLYTRVRGSQFGIDERMNLCDKCAEKFKGWLDGVKKK